MIEYMEVTGMNKEALAALLKALFSDIKDAKTLALRAITIFLAMLSYFIITNQGALIDYAKNFSRNAILSQERTEIVLNYPKKAREIASILYTQTGADGVFIAEYKPKFVNNYTDIIAWEGALNINPSKFMNMVIDRSSKIYQQQMFGKSTSYIFDHTTKGIWGTLGFITSGKEYTDLGINYLYSCPVFDLANSYSGYIGIGYKSVPFNNAKEESNLTDYLQRVCQPQARALGRAK